MIFVIKIGRDNSSELIKEDLINEGFETLTKDVFYYRVKGIITSHEVIKKKASEIIKKYKPVGDNVYDAVYWIIESKEVDVIDRLELAMQEKIKQIEDENKS